MSDAWGIDDSANGDLGNGNELHGPKALRDAYEAMKRQNKELQDGLASIQTELRSQKIASVFESLGVPGAASLYQGDPDPEKAKAWIESMQGVFGNGSTQPASSAPASTVTEEQREQLKRMTEAGQQGTPMGNMDAAFAAVGDATDLSSLIAGFQNATRTT